MNYGKTACAQRVAAAWLKAESEYSVINFLPDNKVEERRQREKWVTRVSATACGIFERPMVDLECAVGETKRPAGLMRLAARIQNITGGEKYGCFFLLLVDRHWCGSRWQPRLQTPHDNFLGSANCDVSPWPIFQVDLSNARIQCRYNQLSSKRWAVRKENKPGGNK